MKNRSARGDTVVKKISGSGVRSQKLSICFTFVHTRLFFWPCRKKFKVCTPCPVFLTNLEGMVGKAVKVGKVRR